VADRRRIGVNLLWLVPGVVGGSEEYTTRLLAGIAEEAPDDLEIVLFTNKAFAATYPELVDAFATVVAPVEGAHKSLRILAETTWLAGAARRERMELLHHAGGTIPPLRLTPSIVTIHDLQPLLLPSNFSPVKQAYLRWRLPPSARGPRLITTLTEHTKRTIVERLSVAAERVVVVPPGYSVALTEPPTVDPVEAYELHGPFFLYPAITYPHKNHLVLVRAFAQVVAHQPDALLVLTSSAAQMEQAILDEADALGLQDNIRRLGRVARGDLDWMVRHAVAVTFPSRFEGFGLPVLEAMGNGCPVIASSASALPEVVGEAGILVDPDDVDGWATAMIRLLDEQAARDWYVEAGLAQTARYRWAASASALVAAYRRAR
jgi:alpha-1,3-rhamnosyl/mannosyltransferase